MATTKNMDKILWFFIHKFRPFLFEINSEMHIAFQTNLTIVFCFLQYLF